jgi:phenylacetate-CoA ligase
MKHVPHSRVESKEKKRYTSAFLDSLSTKTSKEFSAIQEKHLLTVFKHALTTTKAYKKLLLASQINYKKIITIKDLEKVPPMTKKNYLRKYSWEELCQEKAFTKNPIVMTSTSGSTGDPFYFPRETSIDLQSSVYHEMFLRSSKIDTKKSTLIIDCFGMGVWIGGLITYQAFKHISEKGIPLTIITPGINKHEIFQALRNIAPHFDQIIMCGYPPFMKDIIDQAPDHGISWKKYNLKIIFAAEGFSETFRDYIVKHLGIKNPYRDTMNIYGSADIGTMAEESPLSILVRRLALDNQGLYSKLFGQASRLPTLAQYIPEYVSFEEKNGTLYLTGNNVLPLVRYEIGDSGAVFTYDRIKQLCKEEGIDIIKECKRVGIVDTVKELPFVCVYERSDFSTKLYGAIIYPEYIKKGLQKESLQKYITGKFTMYTRFNDKEDEYLEVNVELKHHVEESQTLRDEVTKAISQALIEESAEHKNNSTLLSKGKIDPVVIFWPAEHETHFKPGGKHKWAKR